MMWRQQGGPLLPLVKRVLVGEISSRLKGMSIDGLEKKFPGFKEAYKQAEERYSQAMTAHQLVSEGAKATAATLANTATHAYIDAQTAGFTAIMRKSFNVSKDLAEEIVSGGFDRPCNQCLISFLQAGGNPFQEGLVDFEHFLAGTTDTNLIIAITSPMLEYQSPWSACWINGQGVALQWPPQSGDIDISAELVIAQTVDDMNTINHPISWFMEKVMNPASIILPENKGSPEKQIFGSEQLMEEMTSWWTTVLGLKNAQEAAIVEQATHVVNETVAQQAVNEEGPVVAEDLGDSKALKEHVGKLHAVWTDYEELVGQLEGKRSQYLELVNTEKQQIQAEEEKKDTDAFQEMSSLRQGAVEVNIQRCVLKIRKYRTAIKEIIEAISEACRAQEGVRRDLIKRQVKRDALPTSLRCS